MDLAQSRRAHEAEVAARAADLSDVQSAWARELAEVQARHETELSAARQAGAQEVEAARQAWASEAEAWRRDLAEVRTQGEKEAERLREAATEREATLREDGRRLEEELRRSNEESLARVSLEGQVERRHLEREAARLREEAAAAALEAQAEARRLQVASAAHCSPSDNIALSPTTLFPSPPSPSRYLPATSRTPLSPLTPASHGSTADSGNFGGQLLASTIDRRLAAIESRLENVSQPSHGQSVGAGTGADPSALTPPPTVSSQRFAGTPVRSPLHFRGDDELLDSLDQAELIDRKLQQIGHMLSSGSQRP